MTRLGILFAAFLLQTIAPQNARGTMEGIVVLVPSGTPAPRASVELTVVEGARVVSRMATTDANGRFSFVDLPPNEGYQLVVTGAGLWPTAYGQQRSRGPWTPLTLAAGERRTNLRIEVSATTQISGKIVDSLGMPLVGTSVVAMRPAYVEGQRELQRSTSTVTNMRGEYQFTNLTLGRYYIRVSPRNEGSIDALFINPALYDRSPTSRGNVTKEVEGYRTSYYPGGPLETARPVRLGDSQVLEHIDVTVTKNRTSRVRGNVADESGRRVRAAQIMLLPVDTNPDSNWNRFFDSKDGLFDLRTVQPGMYFLYAVAMPADRPLTSRTTVEVGSGETHAFNVRVSPGREIKGRVVLNGRDAATPDLSGITVRLVSDASGPIDGILSRVRSKLPSASAPVSADGTFTLRDVTPWDYRVVVDGATGAYLKSPSRLRVEDANNPSFEIVLATDGGRLDGHLIDSGQQDVDAGKVVLVPEARSRGDLYVAMSTSKSGRFQATNIPPGRYKVFAWRIAPEGAWLDPDFLETYEGEGIPVNIQAEGSEFVEMRLAAGS